jgi:hypothetical protein
MNRWGIVGFFAITLASACGSGTTPRAVPPGEGSKGGAPQGGGASGAGGGGGTSGGGPDAGASIDAAGGSNGAGGAAGSTAQSPADAGGDAGVSNCRPNPPAATFQTVVAGLVTIFPAISAGADDAVFISDLSLADANGHVRLWNGSTLVDDLTVDTTQLRDIWAASPSDVWAVGAGSWHRDAAGWTKVTTPSIVTIYHPLKALWRLASNDIIAVTDGDILRWDGGAWSVLSVGPPGSVALAAMSVNGIYASSDDNIWAVGRLQQSGDLAGLQHWDGTSWSFYGRVADGWVPAPGKALFIGSFTGIWGTSANDVWVVGGSGPGSLIHYDGTRWSDVALPNLPDDVRLFDVWSACPSDVWVSGWSLSRAKGYMFHFDGQTWSPEPVTDDQPYKITGSASYVWLVGQTALYARPR